MNSSHFTFAFKRFFFCSAKGAKNDWQHQSRANWTQNVTTFSLSEILITLSALSWSMLRFRIEEPQTNSCISWTLQHKMQFSFLPHSKRKKEGQQMSVQTFTGDLQDISTWLLQFGPIKKKKLSVVVVVSASRIFREVAWIYKIVAVNKLWENLVCQETMFPFLYLNFKRKWVIYANLNSDFALGILSTFTD